MRCNGTPSPNLDRRASSHEESDSFFQGKRYDLAELGQRKRLADAERKLQLKTTKKATEDVRIATAKVEWGLGKLADLRRVEPESRDARILPGVYAPVMIWEDGQRVVKPMHYQCRPAGKPAKYDVLYPGTYNARRDNLEGFWKDLFGFSHGIMVVNAFYEHVKRDGEDVVLELPTAASTVFRLDRNFPSPVYPTPRRSKTEHLESENH